MRWRSYNRESAPPVAAWMAMALLALAGCHGNVQPAEGLEEIRQERQPPHLQLRRRAPGGRGRPSAAYSRGAPGMITPDGNSDATLRVFT